MATGRGVTATHPKKSCGKAVVATRQLGALLVGEKCCRLLLSSSILKAAIHFRFVSSSRSSSNNSNSNNSRSGNSSGNNCSGNNCSLNCCAVVNNRSQLQTNQKQCPMPPLATATVAAAATKALPALLNVIGRRQRCRQSAKLPPPSPPPPPLQIVN